MRRRGNGGLPARQAAAPAAVPAQPALSPASLPASTARQVAAELSPGEGIEWVAHSGARFRAVKRRWARLQLAGSVSALALISIAGLDLWSWSLYERFGWFLLLSAILTWYAVRHAAGITYVVTNRRAFRLVPSAMGTHVDPVELSPIAPDLSPEDRAELTRRVSELRARHPAPAAPQDDLDGRGVSVRLRAAAEAELAPGERLLWLARPSAGQYVMLAPLDGWTLLGAAGAAVAGLLAALTGWSTLWLGSGGMLAITGFWLGSQIRATVYALTDWRGFQMVRGRCVREYGTEKLRTFLRVQNDAGCGSLRPRGAAPADGFLAVPDVKRLEDLIQQRPTRDQSVEVTPAEAPAGRGDEVSSVGTTGRHGGPP